VRFDGGHKRDAFLTETFGRFVEWVPVCPAVECNLGTPRESMRLVRVDDGVRLLTVKSGVDLSAQMGRFSRSRVSALAREDLSGYVLKKDSPTCGLERGEGVRPSRDSCPRRPLAFVTVFGATATAQWYGGRYSGISVALLGLVGCVLMLTPAEGQTRLDEVGGV